MTPQASKKLMVGVLLVALSLASLAWMSTRAAESQTTSDRMAPPSVTVSDVSEPSSVRSDNAESAATAEPVATADETRFNEGYRAGYRDAQADLAAGVSERANFSERSIYREVPVYRRASVRPARVVRARSVAVAPRRGHSTRNMILRIAAPAAIGAGIGGIASGKKGAGIGALLGGGGGAIYQLLRDRDRRR